MLLLCVPMACQNGKREQVQKKVARQQEVYTPKKGGFVVVSNTVNPEVESVSLLKDNHTDSVSATKPEKGKFRLAIDDANLNEIYYLKVTGRFTKPGTSGLEWQDLIPVLATSRGELTIVQKPFNHVGSISKVHFSVEGGGEEQQLLNNWHQELVALEAEEGSQTEEYAIGNGSQTKISAKKRLSETPASIAGDFIGQQKPLISTFYLIYRWGKHREHTQDYQKLLAHATGDVPHSKYAVDLAARLAKIQDKVGRLDLENQVVATDTHLAEIPWKSFSDRKYLLLSFWNSADVSSARAITILEKIHPELTAKGIEVLPISMENRFSKWQEAASGMHFTYNYKMRNEAQQSLIDTLYLSDLPRLVLVKPNGDIVNDDLSLDQIKDLE